LNFYQIQTKFRDEIRPRFGLMRGREFIMKDAYSFDKAESDAKISYQKVYDAYTRIFTRCGLTFRPVEADTGLIGGSSSHEFMVLADTGEETIVYSDTGTYAANVERAEVADSPGEAGDDLRPLTEVNTPQRRTVEEVTRFLKIAPRKLVKTLLYTTEHDPVAILVRGDHDVNEIKVKRLLGVTNLDLAASDKVQELTGAPVGYAGPVGLKGVRVLADQAIKHLRNFVIGANKADTHFVDANAGRDFTVDQFGDLRNAQTGDMSPRGDGPLKTAKGIEVGHVFMLGTKYSEAMSAKFLDAHGQEQSAVMGCYGIGVSRTAAAAIEQNHDAKGIIWPIPIAPFLIHLLPVSQSQPVMQLAQQLYHSLTEGGIDVLWDDRDERAGVKFNDADLIGAPFHLVLGDKGLTQGVVEIKSRTTGQTTRVPPDAVLSTIRGFLTPPA
jgi:prolyl-tRNA synthetase